MIKGIRWHFIVLFLAASPWIASGLTDNHRQKRQLRNFLYLQQLRRARYLPPIPIFLPPYYHEPPEAITLRPPPKSTTVESPWIPMDGASAEEVSNQNVYVPPLRPPSVIVTKKPQKTTFDVPLTKSIQVSQAKPDIQTTGYIKKNFVKIHVARTTENPQLRTPGTQAESTVQTLLNFTPVDDRWRPKTFTTPRPTPIPNPNFGRHLGTKVDKHLNYTGVRYGNVNSVVKTLPQSGGSLKVAKNETNFVMRFTPEDVKFSSVEVRTEKIDTPFYADRPGDFKEQNAYFDGFTDPQRTAANLRKEGNIPYQGSKTPMKKVPAVSNSAINTGIAENYKDRKTIFDNYPNSHSFNTEYIKKDIPQIQSQSTFINDPYNAERIISLTRNINNDPYRKVIAQTNEPNNNQIVKNTATSNSNTQIGQANIFSKPSSNHAVNANQNVKANVPFRGQATLVNNPSFSENRDRNKINLPFQGQQNYYVHKKPEISPEPTKTAEEVKDHKVIHIDPSKSAPQSISSSNKATHPYINKKDSVSVSLSPSTGTYKFNSIANFYKNNNTISKDVITVAEIPLTIDNQPVVSNAPNTPNNSLKPKNSEASGNIRNNQKGNSHHSSPNSPATFSITRDDVRTFHKNRGAQFQTPEEISAFDQIPQLKEVELKNPPEYLQFGNEDFLRPIIPIHTQKEQNFDKTLSAFTFSAKDSSEEANKKDFGTYGEAIQKLPKKFSQTTASKVEYYESSKFEDSKPSSEIDESVYFQPVFPDTTAKTVNNHQDSSKQRFENYNNGLNSQQTFATSNEDILNYNSASNKNRNENSKPFDTSREKYRINKEEIVTKNTNYSPENIHRSNIQSQPNDLPRIITPPPVITVIYESAESDKVNNKANPNRTDNYVIQKKPALSPDISNRPRKPKITLSTGMLAGILIAALVFLGFLTGSMVYAFHQWKFGRRRGDRQKKKTTRNPAFPPEYLDENFAGNTYIHNNIFLPTPQNLEDRNTTDADTTSMTGDDIIHDQPPSTRVRRHPMYRETRDD